MECPPPGMEEKDLVQELAGKEAPAKYFQPHGIILDNETLPVVDLPVIDVSLLTSSSPSVAKAETQKLASALTSYSNCLVTNHGMTSAFLDCVDALGRGFFELPLEERLKFARKPDGMEGYGFDLYPSVYQTHEWHDRMMIFLNPECERKMELWPDKPTHFKETMKQLGTKSVELLKIVLKGMTRSLNLDDDNVLIEETGDPFIAARFNYYPSCSRPDRVLGINEHTDPTVIAFTLLDKQVEGTHIQLKDGQWFKIPAGTGPDDSVLVMIGDQGEIMCNGLFQTSLHRVAVNSERERHTTVLFIAPEPNKPVGPVEGLGPARYKSVLNYAAELVTNPDNGSVLESKKIK